MTNLKKSRPVKRLLKEPPFRLAGKAFARFLPCSFATKVYWESLERPQYAAGLLFAATEAASLGEPEILAVEFGVANGNGLLVMQAHAAAIQRELGVKISVFGFDLGTGLPEPIDYRDHPERWKAGDYPMDKEQLVKKLLPETSLVLGDVAETVPEFVARQPAPLGFAAFDLDFYSSTIAALQILSLPGRRILPATPLYFDDIDLPESHRFAGELLALDVFNTQSCDVKVDVWRGLVSQSAYSESPWIARMYMAHDLAVSQTPRTRTAVL